MTTEERIVTLMASANPIPDEESLELDSVTARLTVLTEGSSEVTKLETRTEQQQRSSKGLLLGIAAAVVAILGVGLILLTQSSEEVPPATNPPPSTVVVPTTAIPEEALDPRLQDAVSVATAFSEASAAGDIEEMQSLALQDGHTLSILGMVGIEVAESEIAWREAVGWTTDVDECVLTNPDVQDTRITCHFTHDNAISDALGVGPYWGRQHFEVLYEGDTKFSTVIDKTTIAYGLTVEFATTAFRTEAADRFLTWLEASHPDDVETMIDFSGSESKVVRFGNGVPNLSTQSIDLWRQHVAEFIAEQN